MILKALGKIWMLGAVVLGSKTEEENTGFTPEQQTQFDELGSEKLICEKLIIAEVTCYHISHSPIIRTLPSAAKKELVADCAEASNFRIRLNPNQKAVCDSLLEASLMHAKGQSTFFEKTEHCEKGYETKKIPYGSSEGQAIARFAELINN